MSAIGPRPLLLAACLALCGLGGVAPAQPTYKLEVKPDLKPRATLKVEAGRVVRSAVADDPGFRLQYHFKKDGKALAVVEARSQPAVAPPATAPGTYTVVLELFYPAYKGGPGPRGQYRPISNVLTFRVEPGTPPRIVPVEPKPAPPRK
jgi:hypothetical protein